MSVDFTPNLGTYRDLSPFRYWCQKVIPLVYDDSLSYYELLCKVVDYLNKTMEDVGTLHEDVVGLHDAYAQLQTWVNNYFDNLDVQKEINHKLDEMTADGTLSNIIYQYIGNTSFPMFVTTVDEMTNHNRVYVLASSGSVYYWNGTTFVDSGIKYGSGNGCVSCFNHLISPDTVEALGITSVDDLEKNMIYAISGSDTEYVSNLPDYRYNGILIDCGFHQNSDTGRVQLFYTSYQAWFRVNWTQSWSDWRTMSPSSEVYITTENYTSYSDIRTLPTNSIYAISGEITSEMVSNLPKYGTNGVIYKVNINSSSNASFNGEILLAIYTGRMYYQLHFGTVYSNWCKLDNTYPYVISSDNTQHFTSYDDFEEGSYIISDTTNVLENAPTTGGVLGTLICKEISSGGFQMFFQSNFNATVNCRMYVRYKWASNWSTWYPLGSNGYNYYGNAAIDSFGFSHDLNEYKSKITIAIGPAIDETGLANLPTYNVAGLLTVENFSEISLNGVTQTYITSDNTVYMRLFYANTWHDWIALNETGYSYFINTNIIKPFNLDSDSHVIAFGDSITAGYGVGADNVWIKVMSDRIGFTLTNKAVSAARFDETVENCIKAQYESVTEEQWASATHVFIAGGVNDASRTTDLQLFRQYVINTITYIRQHTDAAILFVTPIERGNTTFNTIHYSSIINAVASVRECSVVNGYDVPIPFRTTKYYDNLTIDGIHPNINGQKIYARYITQLLL